MKATTPQARFSRVPWGLLGMACLVLAVEWTIARHDLDLTTPFALDWQWSRRAAETAAPGCTILAFGDSLIKFGVAPRIFEKRLGGRAYNLSLAGGPMSTSYFQLRRALLAGARPKAILIDGELLNTDMTQRIQDRVWPEFLDTGECLDISITARSATMFGKVILGRLFPSVRSRFEIRVRLRELLAGTYGSQRPLMQIFKRNWSANQGAQINVRDPNYSFEHVVKSYFPYTWECDPVNAAYTRRFLKLAQAHNLPVFWLLPPVSPLSQERRDQCGGHERYLDFLRALQARFPNVVVIDGRRAGYDQTVHCDESHLDWRGAAVFSADVAAALETCLNDGPGAPRWVELPPYRESMADGSLVEDFSRSRIALRDAYARRRR